MICPSGFACPDGLTKTACLSGYYSNGESSICSKCDIGYVSSTNSSYCSVVVPGYEWVNNAIRSCSRGFFSDGGFALCKPCGVGFYQNFTGSSFCLPCPSGYKCPIQSTNGGGATTASDTIAIRSFSTTQFIWVFNSSSSTGSTIYPGFYWMAIGN